MESKVYSSSKSLENTNRTHYFAFSQPALDFAFAIPTDKSLLLYTLNDNLSGKYEELTFWLDSIACREEKNEFDVGVDRKALHRSFPTGENTELVTLMLDSTLSPHAQRAVSFKAYKSAKWSPRGADSLQRPVLATLTLDHRLAIYSLQERRKKFKQVVDLAKVFEKTLKGENYAIINTRMQNCAAQKRLYRELQQRCYALAAVDMVWTKPWDIDGQRCCLLLVAMKSGHLVLWKVKLPVTEGCAALLELADAGDIVPSCMHIVNLEHKCVLFVGFNNGLLKSFTVKSRGQDFELLPNTTLWSHDDRILVSNITWDSTNKVLLFGKGVYLIAMLLDVESDAVQVLQQVQEILSPTSNVSGICCGDDYGIVSVQDGNLYQIKFQTQTGLKLQVSKMLIDRRSKEFTWKCHCIRLSPNQVYAIESCSPNEKYDHLVLKTPHHVNFIELKDQSQLYEMINNLSDNASLYSLKDVLCCIRCQYDKTQPKQFEEPVRSWLNQKELWPKFSLLKLKLLRYFLMVCIAYKTNAEDAEERDKLELDRLFLEELILVRHVSDSLCRFVKSQPNLTLTEKDKTSVLLMCKFLKSRQINDAVILKAQNLVTSQETLPEVLETCAMCNTDIETTQVMGENCPKGHKIARCCQSLLLCHDVPYRVCSTCEALAQARSTSERSWLGELLSVWCIFCDGLLL